MATPKTQYEQEMDRVVERLDGISLAGTNDTFTIDESSLSQIEQEHNMNSKPFSNINRKEHLMIKMIYTRMSARYIKHQRSISCQM